MELADRREVRSGPGRRRTAAAVAGFILLSAPGASWAQQPPAAERGGWVDPPAQAAPPAPANPPAPWTNPPRSPDSTAAVDEAAPRAPAPPSTAPTPPARPAPQLRPIEVTPPRPERAERQERPERPERAERPERPDLPTLRMRPGRSAAAEQRRAPRGDRLAAREAAAQELAADYLQFWSAPNAVALEATPGFYAPTVFFHGRAVSARALFEEKRRFAQRWPERRYRARRDTMLVTCDGSGRLCTVRTVFDFTAANPGNGRRSQGAAVLMLGVNVGGDQPVIVSETSWVTARGRVSRSTPFEDGSQ